MTNLEKAKSVITGNFKNAQHGIFDCRNLMNDPMETIYEDDELQIDICYTYSYFEVFGLSTDDFKELERYYSSLV